MIINLSDLLHTILVLLGIGVLVFLVIILKNVLGILKNAKALAEAKDREIRETIDKIPVLVENTNQILEKMPEILDTVPQLLDSVSEVTDKASIMIDDLNGIVLESSRDIEGIIESVNVTMNDVNRITSTAGNLAVKAESTVNDIGRSIDDITYNIRDISGLFQSNKSNLLDYIYILKDFLAEVRRILFR